MSTPYLTRMGKLWDVFCGDFGKKIEHYIMAPYCNRLVSQMQANLAAYRKPAGKLWQLCKVLYVFEHKMQYLLIHAPYTRIVVFWHISNITPLIS